jgi:pimeloyl-ACP methyl ester carboxylesterase
MLTHLEWRTKPQLEQWAEVASFDAPGIARGSEGLATLDAIADAGLLTLDRLGWDRCTVVADEFGVSIAARITAARPDAVQALALGHARLSNRATGERSPVNTDVLAAFQGLARTDYRSWVRAFGRLSAGAGGAAGYDEEFIEHFLERVRPEAPATYMEQTFADQRSWEESFRSLDVPMLLVEHRGCLLFTREGYEDAIAAFPEAESGSVAVKPSASPEFAELLQTLSSRL